MLFAGSYCGLLRGASQIAGINGSVSDAYFSSNKEGFSTNDIRVDDGGWLVWLAVGVVGGSWDVVVDGISLIVFGLAIMK